MSILIALIVGVIVGTAGGYLLLENADTIVVHVIFAVAGSLLGLGASFLLQPGAINSLFSLITVLCSTIGALLFVLAIGGLQKIVPKRAAHQSHVEADDIDEDQ